jgi:hypothetical protein
MGIAFHINIEIYYNYTSLDKIFKVNNFVQAVKFHSSVKIPNILPGILK